ncbi:MAG: hypothetical protein JOZ62_01290 [Acidobacteriaceae bacterium]|nr:hypothetical protein [Acidobacteriaceae bacterium]
MLIHRAESSGLALRNFVHTSQVVGETDLDLVISPEKQYAWLANPERFNRKESSAHRLSMPASYLARFSDQFHAFQDEPASAFATRILRRYVVGCIPAPVMTEYSFWAVSCLPATNRPYWPRLACISMAMMETFVVGHFKNNPKELWALIVVGRKTLFEAFGGQRRFSELFPRITLKRRGHRDAGPDQVTLHAWSAADLREIIENGKIRHAAAELALRVMRKRATIYGKFHCKQLADYVLNGECT